MNIKKEQEKLELNNKQEIDDIRALLEEADRIVIGAGAGLSASAGLNYNDPSFFAEAYTSFLKKGYRTIAEAISKNWYLTKGNATSYWGFWANHINTIHHSQKQHKTYEKLYNILKDKNYFIITTNADRQFFKGGFDTDKVFAMQGNYGLFQCQKACSPEVYENEVMIHRMLQNMDMESLEIRKEDIPTCPKCGGLLCPNLRVDQYFVDGNSMHNKKSYVEFVSVTIEKILFLELGVGYNTPVIIRYPFEEMTRLYENAHLIRVNKTLPQLPELIQSKSHASNMDIDQLFESIIRK